MEKTAGLCRLGKSEIDCYRRHRHSPHAEFGIIGDPAYWRLCRGRHNRHTFAVRRLLAWSTEGIDVNRQILALATYLGHAKVSDTYWYLSAVPELLALTARRFEAFARQPEVIV